jgi:hypothetical protein
MGKTQGSGKVIKVINYTRLIGWANLGAYHTPNFNVCASLCKKKKRKLEVKVAY